MADIKPISVPSKRLTSSITASSSTIQLDNIEGWDGNDLTASDFGSVAYAVLRNEANTLLELIEIDPTTIASSSITVNKRGLKFTGDLTTEVTANKLSWVKNATIVELGSNPPQLLKHYVDTIAAQTISGIKTFSVLPATTAGNPVADNDLARKAYVDSVVAGSFPADRLVVAGTAGETVADGELLYFDETDNEWKLADASTAATSENVLLGIAQGAGTNGNAITNGVLLKGLDDAQSGMTIGDVMYLSDTAGDISSSAGTVEVNVGIAKSATELYFTPRFLHFLTEDEQDALAGSSGTPSATNKYVTADDVSNAAASGKIVRASGTALPALDGSNLTGIAVFGGDGSDGALSIASGTTTLDLSGASIFIKNYTSISITGTGVLAFSNPSNTGTIIILKSQGNVTITSSATRAIDLRSLGSIVGSSGDGFFNNSNYGSGGTGGAGWGPLFSLAKTIFGKAIKAVVGAAGADGSGTTVGGKGAGALVVECAGAYNFDGGSTVDATGIDGQDGSVNQPGGGGGAGGTFVVIYNTLTTDAGTYSLNGGAGGDSTSTGGTGGGGGGNRVSGGNANAAGSSDDGTGGAAGGGSDTARGGGGAGGYKVIAANTEFF